MSRPDVPEPGRRFSAQIPQPQFDPPPRTAYEDSDVPCDSYEDDRSDAPRDSRAHALNQIMPYDDERAEAGWNRAWDEDQAYTHRSPPPPTDYDLGRMPRPSASRHRRDDRYNDSYDDDRYDNDNYFDDRNRDGHSRSRRRRSAEEDLKEKTRRYPSDPMAGGRDALGGSEGERGIAAKLIGGASGALAGQTFGRGRTLETLAGAAVGAIAASAIEKQIEKRREGKLIAKSDRDGHVIKAVGRDSRSVRVARDPGRSGLTARIRSLSRREGRSLSRQRASGGRRRRSESYDGLESFRHGSSR